MSTDFPKRFSSIGANLLDRISPNSQNKSVSEIQSEVDGLVENAVSTVSNEKTMASLFGAGLAGRFIRAGAVAGLGKSLAPLAVQSFSHAASLAGESAIFAGMERKFASWEGHAPVRSFQKDWALAAINLGSIKLFGGAATGENLIVQHLLIDAGMVGGHQLAYQLKIGEKPVGGGLTQFLRAEALNWQMKGGMSLAHGLFPALGPMEKSLDLSLSSKGKGPRVRMEDWFSLFPRTAIARVGVEGPGKIGRKSNPLEDFNPWMASAKDSKDKGHGERPKAGIENLSRGRGKISQQLKRPTVGFSPGCFAGIVLGGSLLLHGLTKYTEFPSVFLYAWYLSLGVGLGRVAYRRLSDKSLLAKEIDFPRLSQWKAKRKLTASEFSKVDRLVEGLLKRGWFSPFSNYQHYSKYLQRDKGLRVNWGDRPLQLRNKAKRALLETLEGRLQYAKDENEFKSLFYSYKQYLGQFSLLLEKGGFYDALLLPFYEKSPDKSPTDAYFYVLKLYEQAMQLALREGMPPKGFKAILKDIEEGHRRVMIDTDTDPGSTLFKIEREESTGNSDAPHIFDKIVLKIEKGE